MPSIWEALGATSDITHHQKQLLKILEHSCCVITETVFSLTLCEDLLLEFEVDK